MVVNNTSSLMSRREGKQGIEWYVYHSKPSNLVEVVVGFTLLSKSLCISSPTLDLYHTSPNWYSGQNWSKIFLSIVVQGWNGKQHLVNINESMDMPNDKHIENGHQSTYSTKYPLHQSSKVWLGLYWWQSVVINVINSHSLIIETHTPRLALK